MAVHWTLTFDCAHPASQAAFWCLALGYVEAAPPKGFASWADWHRHWNNPPETWDDVAAIEDPDGVGPARAWCTRTSSTAVRITS